MEDRVLIEAAGPYDLGLSLRAATAFSPEGPRGEGPLRLPLRLGGRPRLAEVRQVSTKPAVLEAVVKGRLTHSDREELRLLAAKVVSAHLDPRPFYRLASRHEVMREVTARLRGLKPLRPATVFEMAVIALTEQQISMKAAYRVRRRLVEALGERVNGEYAFPSPDGVAACTVEQLRTCGLSARKAECLIELSRRVSRGEVDLEGLAGLEPERAREAITSLRGFGPWAAGYILVRGLGLADEVPAEDLGVRTVTGLYLGGGERVDAGEAMRLLRPFAPYRGLAAFYLLAHHRLG